MNSAGGEERSLVVVATHNPPKLGVGVYLDGLVPAVANALRPAGWRTELWANPSAIEMAAPAVSDAAVMRAIPALERPATRYGFGLGRLPLRLRQAGADAVLFANDPILGLGLPPSVALIHDLNEFEIANKYGFVRSAIRSQLLRRALRGANQIVVSTAHVHDQVRRFAPYALDRTTVVRPGHATGTPIEADHSVPLRSFLLVVGRIDPVGKNLAAAVEVFDAMQPEEPGLRLVFVGGVNPSIEAAGTAFLESIAQRPDIEFLGHVPDRELALLYRSAQATVFMSRHEGFGLPVVESMGHGCPVIVSGANPTAAEIAQDTCIAVDEARLGSDLSLGAELWHHVRAVDRDALRQLAERFDWAETGRSYAGIIERLV